jgi:hypothetical protein
MKSNLVSYKDSDGIHYSNKNDFPNGVLCRIFKGDEIILEVKLKNNPSSVDGLCIKIERIISNKTDDYIGYFNDVHVIMIDDIYYSVDEKLNGQFVIIRDDDKSKIVCNKYFSPIEVCE